MPTEQPPAPTTINSVPARLMAGLLNGLSDGSIQLQRHPRPGPRGLIGLPFALNVERECARPGQAFRLQRLAQLNQLRPLAPATVALMRTLGSFCSDSAGTVAACEEIKVAPLTQPTPRKLCRTRSGPHRRPCAARAQPPPRHHAAVRQYRRLPQECRQAGYRDSS